MAKLTNDPKELLKGISTYDIDDDSDKVDNRKALDLLFHRLIMSDDPEAKQFMKIFIDNVSSIIYDMGLLDDKPEDQADDIDGDIDDMGDDNQDDDEEVLFGDEDETDGDTEEDTEEDLSSDIPDSVLGDSYDPLIDTANSFLYM